MFLISWFPFHALRFFLDLLGFSLVFLRRVFAFVWCSLCLSQPVLPCLFLLEKTAAILIEFLENSCITAGARKATKVYVPFWCWAFQRCYQLILCTKAPKTLDVLMQPPPWNHAIMIFGWFADHLSKYSFPTKTYTASDQFSSHWQPLWVDFSITMMTMKPFEIPKWYCESCNTEYCSWRKQGHWKSFGN